MLFSEERSFFGSFTYWMELNLIAPIHSDEERTFYVLKPALEIVSLTSELRWMYQNGSERYLAVLGIDRTANAILCHVMTSSELVKKFIIFGQNSSKLATAKLRNPIKCVCTAFCVKHFVWKIFLE